MSSPAAATNIITGVTSNLINLALMTSPATATNIAGLTSRKVCSISDKEFECINRVATGDILDEDGNVEKEVAEEDHDFCTELGKKLGACGASGEPLGETITSMGRRTSNDQDVESLLFSSHSRRILHLHAGPMHVIRWWYRGIDYCCYFIIKGHGVYYVENNTVGSADTFYSKYWKISVGENDAIHLDA